LTVRRNLAALARSLESALRTAAVAVAVARSAITTAEAVVVVTVTGAVLTLTRGEVAAEGSRNLVTDCSADREGRTECKCATGDPTGEFEVLALDGDGRFDRLVVLSHVVTSFRLGGHVNNLAGDAWRLL
jgi:uncharacterized low-complexity protein